MTPATRRRVALARAVAGAPDVLLVDEPAAGFDDADRRRDPLARAALTPPSGGAVIWATRRLDVLLGLASG